MPAQNVPAAAADAQRYLESRQSTGKLVLSP